MYIAILKKRGDYHKGDNNTEEMAKKHKKMNMQTIKLLEKTHASYEKQANKIQMHIEFEISGLTWLNIQDFKMLEVLAS
jgi:hypothetical protein